MSFFQNFDWSFKSIAKVLGVVLLSVVGLSIVMALLSFGYHTVSNIRPMGYTQGGYGATMDAGSYDYRQGEVAMSKMSFMPPSMPAPDYSAGNDAEEFEVKTYSGTIQTRKLDSTCDLIGGLKEKSYVIFEDSNKNDESCYYRFKVKKDKTVEIVKIIEDLKPETLNANIQSIKSQVEGTEDEMVILQKKLTSIEETLEGAQSAYDQITQLATRQNDAETLAKIIDSKLNLIERLTSQRMDVKMQIDRYGQEKADQLDRLDYTFFEINVIKDLIVDWKEIKDSWNAEVRELVRNVNATFQAITLNLITFLLHFAQAILYLFISLILLKFVWKGVKKIWGSEFTHKKK